MPYTKQAAQNGVWNVINTETHEVKAQHFPPDAEHKADRQVKLLNEIEKNPDWDKEDGSD
jgi:hypothetical protein